MSITILQAHRDLTKTYWVKNGAIKKSAKAKNEDFSHLNFGYNDIEDFYNIVKEASKHPNTCLIRGTHIFNEKEHKSIPRKTVFDNIEREPDRFFKDSPNNWIVCDFDEYPLPDDVALLSKESIEYVITTALPKEFHNVSYVAQWSASAGIINPDTLERAKSGFNCHVYFILDTPTTSKDIKTRMLHNHIELNKSKNHDARCGVDGAMFQAVQPCFISPVILNDGLVDTIEDKILYIKKEVSEVPVVLISKSQDNKNKLKFKKEGSKLSGYTSVSNGDSDIIVEQLQQLGCFIPCNNLTFNLQHPNETSKGGWYAYYSNPSWIMHHGQDTRHVQQWVGEFLSAKIQMPEELKLQAKHGKTKAKTKQYLEFSGGSDEVSSQLIIDEYVEFLHRDTYKAMVIITNPGWGKTTLIPRVMPKVVYARGNNKGVVELYHSLKYFYPKHKINYIYSFKLTFKKEFPKAKLVEIGSIDPFGGDNVDWSETFKLMGIDAGRAKALYGEHQSTNTTFDPSADINIMTTTRLKQMTNGLKKTVRDNILVIDGVTVEYNTAMEYNAPIVNYDNAMGSLTSNQQGLFGGFIKNKLLEDVRDQDSDILSDTQQLRFSQYFKKPLGNVRGNHNYDVIEVIPTDTVIVIDDITEMDTGSQKLMTSDDMYKLDGMVKRNIEFNTKTQLEHDERLTDDSVINNIRAEHLDYIKKPEDVDHGEVSGLDFIKKPEYMKMTNSKYKTIYTAAEMIQLEDIETMLDHYGVPYKEVNFRELEQASNVTMIPTDLTRADSDGLLYVLNNYSKRLSGQSVEYIADGTGGEWNHTNTKGVNSLAKSNICFKISRQHPDAKVNSMVKTAHHIVDVKYTNREYTKAMGDAEQVIGRNSGKRSSGFKTYGFINGTVWSRIKANMVYECRTTVDKDDEYGVLLMNSVKDIQKWFKNRDYDKNSFINDCDLGGDLDAKDFKRLIRIIRAVESTIEECRKKTEILKLLHRKMKDVHIVIDELLRVSRDKDHDSYSLDDLEQVSNIISIIGGLGITCKRFGQSKEWLIFMSKPDRTRIKNLAEELRTNYNRPIKYHTGLVGGQS